MSWSKTGAMNTHLRCAALFHGIQQIAGVNLASGLASSGGGKRRAPMQALGRERLGISGGAFSPRGAAYGHRISPTSPSRGGWRGGGAPPKLVWGPLDAMGENVVMALLASVGGLPLEDAKPWLACSYRCHPVRF